jgi:hypothetical protein
MNVKTIFSSLLCLKNFVCFDAKYTITYAINSALLMVGTIVTDDRAERSTARHVLTVRSLWPRRIQTSSHGQ